QGQLPADRVLHRRGRRRTGRARRFLIRDEHGRSEILDGPAALPDLARPEWRSGCARFRLAEDAQSDATGRSDVRRPGEQAGQGRRQECGGAVEGARLRPGEGGRGAEQSRWSAPVVPREERSDGQEADSRGDGSRSPMNGPAPAPAEAVLSIPEIRDYERIN